MGEEKLVPEFLGALPRRNSSAYVFFRVGFGYVLIFSASLALGMLFFSFFSTDVLSDSGIAAKVVYHFQGVFDGCRSFKDYFTVIITSSAPDLRVLFLLFASGFTYFCGIATYAFTVCRAFTVGFSLKYLILMCDAHFEDRSVIIVFIAFELLSSVLLIFLSTKSQIFAYDFRRIRGRKSRIIASPTIYLYMLLYLTAFGLVFIINSASCFTSLLLYG